MAKSTARKKPQSKRKTILSRLVMIVWAVATGGGVAGVVAPDLPLVGPLVQRFLADYRAEASQPNAQADQGLVASLREKLSGSPAGEGQSPALPPSGQLPVSPVSSRKPADTVTIATFNIQVFGTSKLAKTWIIDVLSHVIRQFDVVAIQEIRAKEDRIIPEFLAAVNADGSRYDFVIGPRLGRTVSTEQYAFVYDTNRIEVDPSCIWTMQDPKDLLHREPFIARFRARTTPAESGFTFWLMNIHTDPDEAQEEVSVLADAFQLMQTARADEDDVILLGDLNASDRQFGRLAQVPGIAWVVTGTTTNTRHTKMYDNVLFERHATAEYTGRWGVVELQSAFGLTLEQALEVSDHLPVWAEFHAREISSRNNIARVPGR